MKKHITTETETSYVVYYGAKSEKSRKKETFSKEQDALNFFNEKEKDFHVSCEKVVVETKTTRVVLSSPLILLH